MHNHLLSYITYESIRSLLLVTKLTHLYSWKFSAASGIPNLASHLKPPKISRRVRRSVPIAPTKRVPLFSNEVNGESKTFKPSGKVSKCTMAHKYHVFLTGLDSMKFKAMILLQENVWQKNLICSRLAAVITIAVVLVSLGNFHHWALSLVWMVPMVCVHPTASFLLANHLPSFQ